MNSPWLTADVPRGSDYDERWVEMARRGQSVHGEANFVSVFQPRTVLDAGCGTGRVAIELARRGVETVGIDIDRRMLTSAVQKAPHLRWFHADLSTCVLVDPDGHRELFDVIVAAGNVMIFLAEGTEDEVVARMAEHLVGGGVGLPIATYRTVFGDLRRQLPQGGPRTYRALRHVEPRPVFAGFAVCRFSSPSAEIVAQPHRSASQ